MELSKIQVLQNQLGEWSDSTFGLRRPPIAPLAHLVKELGELLECPADRMEYADCLMLLLDAYRMTGRSADDLVQACYEKLEINKQRKWGEPDEHGVVEHIRTEP